MSKLTLLLCLLTVSSAAHAMDVRGRVLADGAETSDLEETVLWLDAGASLPLLAAEPKTVVMSQVNKSFSPAVVAIRTGDKVDFENLDDIFHNVFSLDKDTPFDLGLYKGKKHFAPDLKTELKTPDATLQAFAKKGKFLIFCNIHPDMVGRVYVFDHGYYAQSDKNGIFTLPAPAPGVYDVSVDNPRLKSPLKLKLGLPSDGTLVQVKLALNASLRRVRHTRKDGSSYSSDGSSYNK